MRRVPKPDKVSLARAMVALEERASFARDVARSARDKEACIERAESLEAVARWLEGVM